MIKVLIGIRIISLISLFPIFFYWAPWSTCESINMISPQYVENISIPPGTKSFFINHGKPIFLKRGTIQEEPFKFAFTTLAFFIFFMFFVFCPAICNYIEIKSLEGHTIAFKKSKLKSALFTISFLLLCIVIFLIFIINTMQ